MGFGLFDDDDDDDGIFGEDWDGDGKVDAWDDAVSDHMLRSYEREEDDDDDDDDECGFDDDDDDEDDDDDF